jgi:hypothetical protein
MIQWFKRDGKKAMPKNKEGLLLRFLETYIPIVDDTSTYPHEEVDAAVAVVASTVVTFAPSATCTTAAADVGHTTARSAPTRTARAAPAPADAARSAANRTAHSAPSSQDYLKTFDLAATGDPAAPNSAPVNARPLQSPSLQAPLFKLRVASLSLLVLRFHLPLTGMVLMHPLMWASN